MNEDLDCEIKQTKHKKYQQKNAINKEYFVAFIQFNPFLFFVHKSGILMNFSL